MRILLDTHLLLWTLTNDARLSATARRIIEDPDNSIFFSVISPWEVQIKHDSHPDELPIDAAQLVGYCAESGFQQLPVRLGHTLALGTLDREEGARPHRDPFDRMLICQASAEGMTLLTHDKRMAEYTNPCILKV